MSTLFYIDGYNVLHMSRSLRHLIYADNETAREGLIDKVAHMCSTTRNKAVIVFDGQGRNLPETVEHYRGVPSLEVRYAPHNSSADAVIERAVYRHANRLEVVVVSNDRGLRDLCAGMGALVMGSDSFLDTCRESRTDTTQVLTKSRNEQPASFEDGLSEEAIAALKKLRDSLR